MTRKLMAAAAVALLAGAPAFAQQASNPGDTVTVALNGNLVDVCEVEFANMAAGPDAYGGTFGVVNPQTTQSAEDSLSVAFDFQINNIEAINGSPAIGQISAGSVQFYFRGYCNDNFTASITKGNASGKMATTTPANAHFANALDYTATWFWDGLSATAGAGVQSATNNNGIPKRGDMLVRAFWNATSNLVSGIYTDTITLTIAADA
jgi:hypothetical protein